MFILTYSWRTTILQGVSPTLIKYNRTCYSGSLGLLETSNASVLGQVGAGLDTPGIASLASSKVFRVGYLTKPGVSNPASGGPVFSIV